MPACLIAANLCAVHAWGSETCQFAGTSDYDGRIAVTAITGTNVANGTTTVDVRLGFKGTPLPFIHTNYLMQEVSTWKAAELQTLAVNTRYRVDDHVVREIWDVFVRRDDGLDGYRLEAKTPDEFRRKHPAFTTHWYPAAFAQPWWQDFWRAEPERRRDLDLPASSVMPDVRSPLALAFYWGERLPPTAQAATVFLPGFKKDKNATLMIAPAGPEREGAQAWAISVRYPGLDTSRPSTAEALVSAGGHLLQAAAHVNMQGSSANAVIRLVRCTGTVDSPG
ncbi:MAG: hypothetical protein ACREF3_19040 [Acetobacteraceae bacterium]